MPIDIHLLDLVGTATFAFYGAYVGLYKRFDIFGIFMLALISAVGGGTIREILLNHTPFYFFETIYIGMVFLGMILAILAYRYAAKVQVIALLIDAVGLATFAYIGAVAADAAGLGLFGVVFFATVSAVGGGLLRDIVISETPQIFYRDFYASPAIVLGLLYFFLRAYFDDFVQLPYVIIIVAILLRYMALLYRFQLWVPRERHTATTEQNSLDQTAR